MSADDTGTGVCPPLQLVDDWPLDTHGDEVPLGYRPAVETLVRAAQAAPLPSCIALDGPWGAGKTTMAYAAFQRLADVEVDGKAKRGEFRATNAVWFDPWPYERSEDVVTPLLLSMRAQLNLENEGKKKLKQLALNMSKVALTFAARMALGYTFGGDAFPEAKNTNAASAKPHDFQAAWTDLEQFHDAVVHTRKLFAEVVDSALEGTGHDRLFIFLDDLDRCLPDNVVALIEAVKLLLCGAADPFSLDAGGAERPRAVFVFAIDRTVVGEAIMSRYPHARRYTGETYLEKIFDIALQVPRVGAVPVQTILKTTIAGLEAGPQIHTDLDNLLAGKEAAAGGIDLVSKVLSEAVFANPRVIKRTLNRLVLLLQSDAARQKIAEIQRGNMHCFIAWVAGAERYAAFRRFFIDASRSELEELDRQLLLTPESQKYVLLKPSEFPTVRALADLPGIVEYARLLGLNNDKKTGEILGQQRELGGAPPTLGDFDALMRSVGL